MPNPTVTINQAAAQPDPTNSGAIVYDVAFTEPVTGFTGSDISFAGSTVGGALLAGVIGSGANYTVTVSGMTGSGTVVASIPAGAANAISDATPSTASTSTDNTVFFETAAINVIKFVNGEDADIATGPHEAVGSTVTFTYVVTNSGDVPLANVVVSDDKLGPIAGPSSGDINNNGLLDQTETWFFTTTITALAGQQTNTGTVTALDPNTGTPVTDNNPANYFGDAPAINIVKFVNGEDADSATGPVVPPGSTVTFTYVVTNTGNVPLANVVVSDDKLGPITSFTGDTNGNGLLDLTETWTYTTTATAQFGQQTNTGTVTGQDPNTGTPVVDNNPANYFADAPAINVIKFVNGQDADIATGPHEAVGSTVTFTYVVTNSGDVPLANVVVSDDKLGPIAGPSSGDINNNGLLDQTETWFFTTTITALAGQQTNTGTVTALDPNTGTPVTDNNPANYFGDAPAINIVKFVNGEDADSATGPVVPPGSTVTFTYVVTNTGNVPLANVVVSDDKLGPITSFTGDTNGNGLLDLTETWTYTTTATAQFGQQTNTGTVTGQDPNTGTPVVDNNPANYFADAPAINVIKFVNGQDADIATGPHEAVGSTVTFTYVVTNSGDVPLANVVVSDDKLGPIAGPSSGDINNNGLLDQTETWFFTTTITALAGQQTNTGTVTALDPNTGTPVTDNNPANYFGDAPAINIVKFVNGEDADSATGPVVPPGSTVTFTYVVTNTGNVPLANVVVSDDKLGPITSFTGDTNGNGLLDLTETWTYTTTATAQFGQQTNTGTVTGQDPNTGTPVVDNNPANYFADVGSNDSLVATDSGPEALSGLGGDDTLLGFGGGTYTLDGGTGNDQLFAAGSGAETLLGGIGNDTLVGIGTGSYVLDGGANDDQVSTQGLGSETLLGNTGNDTLVGSGNGLYSLDGGIGNDQIFASGSGNDTLFGNAGDDTLGGSGSGPHSMDGGDGNDQLFASGSGAETALGGNGNDTLVGSGTGSYVLDGGANDDQVSTQGLGSETLLGNTGNDTLVGSGNGVYSLDGGDGNDQLFAGGSGAETLLGGNGNDTLVGTGNGVYSLDGGANDDQISATGLGADTLLGNAGNDTLVGSGGGAYSLDGGDGNDLLFSTGSSNETLVGGNGDDNLFATGNGNLSLDGGAGNDTLAATGSGTDTLQGGDGNDVLLTGLGASESLNGGNGNDLLIFTTGSGQNDTLDGGNDNDIVFFQGKTQANITSESTDLSGVTKLIFDVPSGGQTVFVQNVETLQFQDGSTQTNPPGFDTIPP